MRNRRNLSGIFYRYKFPEDEKFGCYCFEELPVEEQQRIMSEYDKEQVTGLALRLAEVLFEIGENLDLERRGE